MIELGRKKQEKKIERLTKDIPNAEDQCDFLRQGKKMNICFGLENLNEALTEEIAIRLQKSELQNNPIFKEEAGLISEYITQKKEKGHRVDLDDILSARKNIIYTIENKESYEIEIEKTPYFEERLVFNILIDKLYENNKIAFQNREEVFDLIAKSSFTGDLVGEKSWGRLMDKTFGKNTFQNLVELDQEIGNTYKLYKFIANLKSIKRNK